MVIFGGARSCRLPAARGLRPQAPAVLPRRCQQGAGSQAAGGLRDMSGPMGLGQTHGSATPRGNLGPSGRANEKRPDPRASASLPGRVPSTRPVARRPPGQPRAGLTSGTGRLTQRDKTSRPRCQKAQVPASPGLSIEAGNLRAARPAGWRPSPTCWPASRTRPALSHQESLRLSAIPGRKPREPRCAGGAQVDPG